MVIGSYMMTNFDMKPIPPGVIDHKEWTDENGRNNALRVNGLGSPRAFYVPFLRKINLPNVSMAKTMRSAFESAASTASDASTSRFTAVADGKATPTQRSTS